MDEWGQGMMETKKKIGIAAAVVLVLALGLFLLRGFFVTDLSLNESQVNLFVEDTAELKIEILPKTLSSVGVKYTSSDEKVAVVDKNGVITAVGSGSCKITASVISGKKASCKVNVFGKDEVLKMAYQAWCNPEAASYDEEKQALTMWYSFSYDISDLSSVVKMMGNLFQTQKSIIDINRELGFTDTVTLDILNNVDACQYSNNAYQVIWNANTYQVQYLPNDTGKVTMQEESASEKKTSEEMVDLWITDCKLGLIYCDISASCFSNAALELGDKEAIALLKEIEQAILQGEEALEAFNQKHQDNSEFLGLADAVISLKKYRPHLKGETEKDAEEFIQDIATYIGTLRNVTEEISNIFSNHGYTVLNLKNQ